MQEPIVVSRTIETALPTALWQLPSGLHEITFPRADKKLVVCSMFISSFLSFSTEPRFALGTPLPHARSWAFGRHPLHFKLWRLGSGGRSGWVRLPPVNAGHEHMADYWSAGTGRSVSYRILQKWFPCSSKETQRSHGLLSSLNRVVTRHAWKCFTI